MALFGWRVRARRASIEPVRDSAAARRSGLGRRSLAALPILAAALVADPAAAAPLDRGTALGLDRLEATYSAGSDCLTTRAKRLAIGELAQDRQPAVTGCATRVLQPTSELRLERPKLYFTLGMDGVTPGVLEPTGQVEVVARLGVKHTLLPSVAGGINATLEGVLGKLADDTDTGASLDQQLRLSLQHSLGGGWDLSFQARLGSLSTIDVERPAQVSTLYNAKLHYDFANPDTGRQHSAEINLSRGETDNRLGGNWEERTTKAEALYQIEQGKNLLSLGVSFAQSEAPDAPATNEMRGEIRFKMPF